MKKIAMLLCAGLFFNSSYAGINGMTVHSRANCVNNESITWWLLNPNNWRVISIHKSVDGVSHLIDTGYYVTWRQAAVHWGEGNSPQQYWQVWGYHYLSGYMNNYYFADTYAVDCNIYNGWWDTP